MAYEQHQHDASQIVAHCAILTLSDTRTSDTNTSGILIRQLLEQDHHQVICYEIIPDDPTRIESSLDTLLSRPDIDTIITNGGTGISRRDNTIPLIQQLLDSPLPGFGELFRMLSYQQIGSGAFLSRALAGVSRGKIVFALPGSSKAVELAMTKLILPEIRHLLHELRKQ